jgi:hypothetical protein
MPQPTKEHLEALAQGRAEGAVVRNYLTALASVEPPKKGRQPRSADDIAAQINETADPVERLKLRAALREAVARESQTAKVDLDGLEKSFIDIVVPYSAKHGLSYADWRAEGVPPAVLKAAGLNNKKGS